MPFLSRTVMGPKLGTNKPVVTREVTLPFIQRIGGARVSIGYGIMFILRSVVKKVSSINPPPPVWIPSKLGQFAIEENDFFSLPFFFGPSIGVNNLDLMKISFNLSKKPFPHSKASRMGAYRVTLHREGMDSIMPL